MHHKLYNSNVLNSTLKQANSHLSKLLTACTSYRNITLQQEGRILFNPLREYSWTKHIKCTWLVSVPHSQLIVLGIQKFDFTDPEVYIEILDGMNENAALLKNFTRKPDFYNQTWRSNGPYLLINFVSNGFLAKEDFYIAVDPVDKPKGTYSLLRRYH